MSTSKISLPYPQYPYTEPGVLLNGGNIYRETIPRASATGDLAALSTGVMLSAAIVLQKGDVVTNLTFRSGGTGAGTPSNWWFALYDTAGALLSQSADQTTTAWAADDHKTLALGAVQKISSAGVYFAAVMVAATTPPSLAGVAVDHAEISDGFVTGQVNLAQTSGSSLTDTAPATIATPTAVVNVPYAVAS